ncbi:MAG: GNAT family N-acetyltransferase, partial [Nocardiopsaceae bacterium]|nr:GNAT family N-acetyltransferase [Nocardiopsaceae bacterium]
MTASQSARAQVRSAQPADLQAIIAIAMATGQDEDWDRIYPGYIGHLMDHGTVLVAERAGVVTGFGATIQIGTGSQQVSMLTDLFVDPAAHGTGTGRAILGQLWTDDQPRMTFSSLHANALPLYTSFGVDAWWPLLYVHGEVQRLSMPPGWTVRAAAPGEASGFERDWTGIDRTAEHRFWAAWPDGLSVVASLDGAPAAAGTTGGAGSEYGVCHLATSPAIDSDTAGNAVLAVL